MASNDISCPLTEETCIINSIKSVKARREAKSIYLEINAVYSKEMTVYRLYDDLKWMFNELRRLVLQGTYTGCIVPPLPIIPSVVFNPGMSNSLSDQYLQGFCLSTECFLMLVIQHPKFSLHTSVERFFSPDKLPSPSSNISDSFKIEASKLISSIKFKTPYDTNEIFVGYHKYLCSYYEALRNCFIFYSSIIKNNERLIQTYTEFSKDISTFINELFFKDSPKEYNLFSFYEETLEFSKTNIQTSFIEVDQGFLLFLEYYSSYYEAALNMMQRRGNKLEIIDSLSKKDAIKYSQALSAAQDDLDNATKQGESDIMVLQHQKNVALEGIFKKMKAYNVRKNGECVEKLKSLMAEIENIKL